LICKWCAGTGEECGCGYGYCAHCDNGETTNPPFGPIDENSEELKILNDKDFDNLNLGKRSALACLMDIPVYMTGQQVLSEKELDVINDYWCDFARDETIGVVMQRVAWLVNQKTK